MIRWVRISEATDMESAVYGRIDNDGIMRITAIEEHPELQEWIAQGNTPEVVND